MNINSEISREQLKRGMAVLLLENTRRQTEMLNGKFDYV
jgi:hypothetical protein